MIPVNRVSVWAGLCTTVACRETTAAFEQNHPNDSFASNASFADDAPTLSTEGRQGTRLRRQRAGRTKALNGIIQLGAEVLGRRQCRRIGQLTRATARASSNRRAARAQDGPTTENGSSCAAWQQLHCIDTGMALGPSLLRKLAEALDLRVAAQASELVERVLWRR